MQNLEATIAEYQSTVLVQLSDESEYLSVIKDDAEIYVIGTARTDDMNFVSPATDNSGNEISVMGLHYGTWDEPCTVLLDLDTWIEEPTGARYCLIVDFIGIRPPVRRP